MLDPLLKDKENVSSVVTIGAALLPSPALLLFVAKPSIFRELDTVHLLLLLTGVGFAMLLVCMFSGVTLREALGARRQRVRRRDGMKVQPREPLHEWAALTMVAGFANLFLLALTLWAYWRPIRVGASLVVLSTVVLLGAFVVTALITYWPIDWTNPRRGQRAMSLPNEGEE